MAVLDQFSRHAANMSSMMASFGVDPGVLASDLLGSAMHVCLDCPKLEVCDDWLAQISPRQAPEFCPNARAFKHAFEIQPRGSTLVRASLDPSVTPFAGAWDMPGRNCEGSLKAVGWEGRLSDPDQPREICCPICKAKMKPALDAYAFYEFEEKDGLYWASVPPHLPGETPEYY
jgi:hypothetical protein